MLKADSPGGSPDFASAPEHRRHRQGFRRTLRRSLRDSSGDLLAEARGPAASRSLLPSARLCPASDCVRLRLLHALSAWPRLLGPIPSPRSPAAQRQAAAAVKIVLEMELATGSFTAGSLPAWTTKDFRCRPPPPSRCPKLAAAWRTLGFLSARRLLAIAARVYFLTARAPRDGHLPEGVGRQWLTSALGVLGLAFARPRARAVAARVRLPQGRVAR